MTLEKPLVLSLLFLVSISVGGCVREGSPEPVYVDYCERYDTPSLKAQAIGTSQSPLFALSTALWPVTNRVIRVCFEPDTFDSVSAADRMTVQTSVEKTWGVALQYDPIPESERYSFSGWGRCTDEDTLSVRIHSSDEAPHAMDLGVFLAGMPNGLTLNFKFEAWYDDCATEPYRSKCIAYTAAHEFGHVLGLAHEQNRPDNDPKLCPSAPQGIDGDTAVGSADLSSIMSYCNWKWNNGGELSFMDTRGIQFLYYPTYFKADCGLEGKKRVQSSD